MNKDTIREIFTDYCCKRILLDLYQLKPFTLKSFKENSPFFGARDKLLRLGLITVNNDEMLKLTPAGETMMATKEYFEKLQTDTAKKNTKAKSKPLNGQLQKVILTQLAYH